jgi:hypothetical protein
MTDTTLPTVKLPVAPEFGSSPHFGANVARFNSRKASAAKRALFSDSKANRARYGVPSANAAFTLFEGADADPKRLAKVLKMSDAFGLDIAVNPADVITATVLGGYQEAA